MANKTGKIEAIARDPKTGVKIDGKWVNLTGKAVDYKKDLKKGDTVEYAQDGSFIKRTMEDAEPREDQQTIKRASEVKEGKSYKSIMMGFMLDVQDIYNSKELDDAFKKEIDWSSHINSMFIAETRNNGKR